MKVALVTGGANGIGRATALRFAHDKISVAIADLDEEGANRTTEEIKKIGGTATYSVCDVSTKQGAGEAVSQAISIYGKVDILVNNVGLGQRNSFLEIDEETWDSVIRVNLKSTFLCSQLAANDMVPRKWGRIINIASQAGLPGGYLKHTPAYSTAKAAVIALTKTVALNLAEFNITCNAVCPGSTKTRMTDPIYSNSQRTEAILKVIPMHRPGSPEEIAHAIDFLASDSASYITGAVLAVDGGWTAGSPYSFFNPTTG